MHGQAQILRVVSDLVEAQLAESRRTGTDTLLRADWTGQTRIRDGEEQGAEGTLGADSLELLELGARVNQFFHLHEWGTEENLLRFRTLQGWADVVGQTIQDDWRKLTFQTSGTSGVPKRITHDRERLEWEARGWMGLFEGVRRCISLVPAHHLYGYQWTVTLPELAGWPVVDGRFWSVPRLVGEMRPGDLVVGIPLRWELIGRYSEKIPDGVIGVSSAGALRDSLWSQLRAAGMGRMLEIYGSTETGGIGWRESESAGYRLAPGWSRPVGEGGSGDRLVWRGAETVELMDRLVWCQPEEFRLAGRSDGAVKVGGTLVHFAQVESNLREHPAVADCRVKAGGAHEARVRAFVVPRPGERALTDQALMRWLSGRLPGAAVPREIVFGTALPVDGNGKEANW